MLWGAAGIKAVRKYVDEIDHQEKLSGRRAHSKLKLMI